MLLVQKYGGTSLADAGRIRAAARRASELSRQGNQMVIVVSAQGDTTDEMIRRASQLNRRRALAKHTGFFLTAPGFSFQERVTDLLLVLGLYRLLRPLLHRVK